MDKTLAGPRLAAHDCSGLRYFWHTLNGAHLRLAEEDFKEAHAAYVAAWDRFRTAYRRVRDSENALFAEHSQQTKKEGTE